MSPTKSVFSLGGAFLMLEFKTMNMTGFNLTTFRPGPQKPPCATLHASSGTAVSMLISRHPWTSCMTDGRTWVPDDPVKQSVPLLFPKNSGNCWLEQKENCVRLQLS